MRYKSSSRDEISKKILSARTYSEGAHSAKPPAIQFTLAYDAARMWCEIVLRAEGKLIKGTAGHHENTIKSALIILGPEFKPTLDHINRARKSRNEVLYEGEVGIINEEDALSMLTLLDQFSAKVFDWLKEKHPDLMPIL